MGAGKVAYTVRHSGGSRDVANYVQSHVSLMGAKLTGGERENYGHVKMVSVSV